MPATSPAFAQGPDIQRIGGKDRYATAVGLSREGWAKSAYVVMTGGEKIADALCAVALAYKYRAPVLFCGFENIGAETLAELERLEAKQVFLIGGPAAVSKSVEDELRRVGIKIERLGGRDRFETSVKVAENFSPANGLVLASEENFWEALVFNTVAAPKGIPVLLTAKNKLPASVWNFLANRQSGGYLLGGHEAVSPEWERNLSWIRRIGGSDRFETNLLILENFQANFNFLKVYAAASSQGADGFMEALAASVLAAQSNSPLFLTKGVISAGLSRYLEKNIPAAGRIIAVGGENAFGAEEMRALGRYWEQRNPLPGYVESPAEPGPASDTGSEYEPESDPGSNPGADLGSDPGSDPDSDTEPDPDPVRILRVSSPAADGWYRAGSTIVIEVVFDGEVVVTGTPGLVLETGETDRIAAYSGGTGSNQISFSYTVQNGDFAVDLDYQGINALILQGGTIQGQDAGRGVNLTLPVPGENNSLSRNKNIAVDAMPPSGILISIQNYLPANSAEVTLTALNGPLTDTSWKAILNKLKENTTTGAWIRGITPNDLSITPSEDGTTAVLKNRSGITASICSDFIIPAASIVDKAGNTASGDIEINAYIPL